MNVISSSWKDSWSSGDLDQKMQIWMDVPEFGCYKEQRLTPVTNIETTKDKIWQIGGEIGWYYGNWLWKIRGNIDKLFGGVGLRRGRRHPYCLSPGDAVDFWRVLRANKQECHLLLFSEMKLPGKAWLEFKMHNNVLYQTTTFRPKGLSGRLYWYLLLPLHGLIFNGLLTKLAKE